MRTTGLLFAMMFIVLLAGCGGRTTIMGSAGEMAIPPNATKCTLNDDCMVGVHVVPDSTLTGCTISFTQPTDMNLEMKSGGLSHFVSHLIRWVLDDESQDANFRFADEPMGVALKDPKSDPESGGQFFKKKRVNKGREYVWRDQNSNTQYYDYGINIIQKGSSRACLLDPRIWNN